MRVDDLYLDLARDYEWLFPDDTVGSRGPFGATSPGSKDLLETALGTLPPGARVLDCSCGIGADSIALARRGFTVTASDGSSSMAAEARRRAAQFGVEMTVTQSDWRELPQRVPSRFELALCLGNSIVHAETKYNRVSAFDGIRRVLSPGGILIVDSRNWELLYESRPRIVPARQVIERNGLRCTSLYIWTIPEDLRAPCRAEIVLLFEDANSAITHRRYVLDFMPFRHADLIADLHSAGFIVKNDSYRAANPFYAVAAAMR